jgi:succinate dehydrogenase/fumarate reductase cytochrome b subunit
MKTIQTETTKAYCRLLVSKLNIATYTPKSKLYIRILRSISGVVIIGVGLATSFIPFTSLPCYIVGGSLLGLDILYYYKVAKQRFIYELHLIYIMFTKKMKGGNKKWK